MALLEQLLQGVKVSQPKRGKYARTRLPITPSLLWLLRGAWLASTDGDTYYYAAMLWAACSLCFFGFFQSGEIMSLSETRFDPSEVLLFRDIAFNEIRDPSVVRLHLKASKTDLFRTGVDIYVGKTGNDLCLITVMVRYLAK